MGICNADLEIYYFGHHLHNAKLFEVTITLQWILELVYL